MPNWKDIAKIGAGIGGDVAVRVFPSLPLIVAAVQSAEVVFKGKGRGKEKKQAVVEFVARALMATEAISDKDLLNDVAVAVLLSNAIDAIVALENGIAAAKLLRQVKDGDVPESESEAHPDS